MKSCVYLLLLFLTVFGFRQEKLNQTDASGLKQGWWQKKYPNGKIMYEGKFFNDKPVGEWKRYHTSGRLKALLLYNTNNDTVKASLFENSEKPVAEGFYLNEKKAGTWKYYSNGVKIAEEKFADGKKAGICRKFYSTGQLLEESDWKDDLKNGMYHAFFTSGKPYLECNYIAGQREGFCTSYFSSGTIEMEAFYKKDLPDSIWKFFEANGKIRYILNYHDGILINPEAVRKMDTRQLSDLEKQRNRLIDPENYLQNPEKLMIKSNNP